MMLVICNPVPQVDPSPHHAPLTTQAVKGVRTLRSLYRKPVVGWARGTYAIAPLEDETLESSAEALITCIIKAGGDPRCCLAAFIARSHAAA